MVREKEVEVKAKPNKSKTYLLPLLTDVVHIPKNIIDNLENTFISDSTGLNTDCISMLFKYSKDESFTEWEDELFEHPSFVQSYDLDDKVLYVLEFPERYIKEYNYFKNGQYSKFGEDTKIMIIKYLSRVYGSDPKVIPIIKKIKQILTKAESLRVKMENALNVPIGEHQELGEMVNMNKETFNFSNYNGK